MLSVVIPALNAGATVGACVTAVRDADGVIVVDGGSSDDTVAIAARAGAMVVHAERGRGRQLIAGAATATGDWLLFLHADTLLETDWRSVADRHIDYAPGAAACFRFRLDADEWRARVLEQAVALRVRGLKLPFGDQGLLISRALYDMVGAMRRCR